MSDAKGSRQISLGSDEHGKPVNLDLDLLLAGRALIQASSGAGKSWTIRRIAEQAFGQVQMFIIDPEGEFATLRERYDFVLVGPGGEAAADVRSAGLLATRLLELNASAICDISELEVPEREQWVAQLIRSLMKAPRDLQRPLLVVVDEAHMFAPESGGSDAKGAMMDLAARGRKRGFCPIIATQRLSKLAKTVAAELQNVLVGRTSLDVDQKRALDALGFTSTPAVLSQLKLLPDGTFFALGRAFGSDVVKVAVGDTDTRAPQPGAHRLVASPAPAAIKELLPQLADLPQEAEEEAQTVTTLRAQIAELKEKLAMPNETSAELERIRRERDEALQAIQRFVAELEGLVTRARASVRGSEDSVPVYGVADEAAVERLPESRPKPVGSHRPVARQAAPPSAPDGTKLGKCERSILTTLAQAGASSKAKISIWTGYSLKSSGFGNAISACRTAGLLTGSDPLSITSEGRKVLGSYTPLPTGQAMIEFWRAKLGKAERAILDAVVRRKHMTREQIAEATGYSLTSSGFGNALSTLRTLQLIEGRDPITLTTSFRETIRAVNP